MNMICSVCVSVTDFKVDIGHFDMGPHILSERGV
jgi:hypothetical protein